MQSWTRLILGLLVLTLSACASAPDRSTAPDPSRPNIVYILADDLGYGDIGAFGQKITRTPVLDRLAREGMIFTRHYAGSTVCAPSRASLMTGLDTGHVSVRGNKELGGYEDENERGQMALATDESTLPEVLRSAGYATAIVGKWGLGGPNSRGEPQLRGFDYAFGYLDQKQSHNYYPTHLWENGKRIPLRNRFFIPHADQAGTSRRSEDYRLYMGTDYAPDYLTSAAIGWLDRRQGKQPFFLYLAYNQPHAALQVPDEELEQYKGLDTTSLDRGDYTPHPRPRAARAGMISRMDRDIGKVLAALQANGQLQNTLVIFTSDNGPGSEGGADLEFFNASGGLRGEKRDLYEGGIRVPMIAWWPGRIAPGSRSDHVSALWDVMPTLSELAGVAPPPGQGISFVPALSGRPQARHEYLYWEFHEAAKPAQAVRFGRWKLVRHRSQKATAQIELFDLANDPAERHNIADERPDVVCEGLRFMERRSPSFIPGFDFSRDQ
ncbi:arylsulfatase [Altererythrobacter sp. GH1-8]|uniref:arylsulfatase n=1 Tax=Altererythrobacter sp. GH1-8 TaxID=3349333 RepID=UPI00374CF0D3